MMWMLDEMRANPAFASVALQYETDVGFHVQVVVVPSKAFAERFKKAASKRLNPSEGRLGEQRRALMLALLRPELRNGPTLVDVELYGGESIQEEVEDFEEPDAFLKAPAAVYIDFKMKKKSPPKGRTGSTAAPQSNAGGPRYVVEVGSVEPGRPTWKANPDYPKMEKMLVQLMRLLRPRRPTLKAIAKKLNDKNHRTLKGSVFTEQNVDRAIIAAELLLGNDDPAF